MSESYKSVLLKRRAKRLGTMSEEDMNRSAWDDLRIFATKTITRPIWLVKVFACAFGISANFVVVCHLFSRKQSTYIELEPNHCADMMFTEPIVTLFDIYNAFNFGLLNAFFAAFSWVYVLMLSMRII